MSSLSKLTLTLGSVLGPAVIRTLGWTWIISQQGMSNYYRRLFGASKRAVYSFWHRDILLLVYFCRNENHCVLISQHSDGELIARTVERMGYTTFRGSTTRGGVRALRELDRIKEDPSNCDIGFTPDGPKGPAKKLKKGVIYAAMRTGFPVVPVGVAVDRSWEISSWDRFRIPKPFSRSFVCFGEEIPVPGEMDDDRMESMRLQVEQAMLDTEQLARDKLKRWCESAG
ncbi:MAG: lysophospholipid acyltransferase family protein [Planctomycetota bacterium]